MANPELLRILEPQRLSAQYLQKSWGNAEQILNRPPEEGSDSSDLIRDLSFFHGLRDRVNQGLDSVYTTAKMTVLTPVGMFGLWEGFAAPDWDISTLGIGYHRFFLFHSAIGLAVLRRFHQKWQAHLAQTDNSFGGRAKQKLAGALLGAGAAGVGLHLLVDVFQPKSVVFPFFGSLIEGTLVDDNIWLLGNSLWAFKISRDVFTLVLADEAAVAKKYAEQQFGDLTGWRPIYK